MKYLVAVSGGIDSVVLLDMLAYNRLAVTTHTRHKPEIIVAHFDHGIRQDSAADARFVEGLATRYGLPFVMRREDLGLSTSEDMARKRRYAFLRSEAKKRGAVIVTAHHQDDLIETIAINLTRGTGWRGLAVFGSADIYRPLLSYTKQQLRDYARTNKLEWVEDSTNASDKYLRNRLRRRLNQQLTVEIGEELVNLWRQQAVLRRQIEKESAQWLNVNGEYERYPLIMIEASTAMELLRSMIESRTNLTLTRPQLERALLAVKTARPGTVYEAGSGVILRFTSSTFIA